MFISKINDEADTDLRMDVSKESTKYIKLEKSLTYQSIFRNSCRKFQVSHVPDLIVP